MEDKVFVNRLRRMADRQGLMLHKTRRRDPLALDYGLYLLADARTGAVVVGNGYSLTLTEVEAWLTRGAP